MTLATTGQKFDRPITGGIYKIENDQPLFADAGISIGSFAPYFRTKRQLVESGDCDEESVNCGDILEITYAIESVSQPVVVAAGADTEEGTADSALVAELCVQALEEEPAHDCSLERRIIDTRSIDGKTELILDRPLPEACLPESGRITYRVRMGDVYGVAPTGSTMERMAPGERMGLGGSVYPTGAIQAQLKPANTDVRSLNACERYGDQGVFLDSRYQRDAMGAFRVNDAHADTLSNGSVVGLVWTLLQTTSGEGMSPAGAPMLLGQTTMWQPPEGLPVIFTSYARSNRVVGLVPYPYTADPDDAFDVDAPFLSNTWRDTPTHFTELN